MRLATPESLQYEIDRAAPGTVIELSPGIYHPPIYIRNRQGGHDSPIIIRGTHGAAVDGRTTFEMFRPRAEREARRVCKAGGYPGLYEIADEAALIIERSSHVRIEGVTFVQSWPTAIYLRNADHITLSSLNMTDGTFAIYAEGEDTHHLEIANCQWVQDTTEQRLWRDSYWRDMHGHECNAGGARAYDGAFFRSRNIRGDVFIHGNTIRHAANGIHMFNRQRDKPNRYLNNNVRIFNNTFCYIKDNAIEPERRAVNWWIWGNRIFNCHKWFSFDTYQNGYFYVFANRGWFDNIPGPADETNRGGAVFKLGDDPDPAIGPTYVVHNSWYLRSTYIKRGAIRNFMHCNNAMQYCTPFASADQICTKRRFFKDFVTNWLNYGIAFEGDYVDNHDFPDRLIRRGYRVSNGLNSGRPGFASPATGDFDLSLQSPCRNKAGSIRMALPDGTQWSAGPGGDVGTAQSGSEWSGPDYVRYPGA